MRKKVNEEIKRFSVNEEIGLSKEQVFQRNQEGLNNKTKIVVGKTYGEIIMNDLFSFFNLLLFGIAILCASAQYFTGLFFLVILFLNIGISLYQDIKARHLMNKLRVLTQPKAHVIREGKEEEIDISEIVLDDIVLLKPDAQVSADGVLLSGNLLVNESQLTGESANIAKQVGDIIYSGSFIVSGNGKMKADKVGSESYVEQLQSEAKKFKRSPSVILKSLRYLFRVLGSIVIIMGLAIFLVYLLKGELGSYERFKDSVPGIAGSMISMIPSGLYLLTSVTLAVAVISLSKKNARVQDFYSIEMLARTNVLCVDKTGTITDGTMNVVNMEVLDHTYNTVDVEQIVSNILHATEDDNFTAKALKARFTYELTKKVVAALPFNSDNKYSAASFSGNETFALGALEFLNLDNPALARAKADEFTASGYRVMVLAKGKEVIKGDKIEGKLSPIAIIVLQDHIREATPRTFAWFKNNDVQIKVISGDDAQTVSEIAKKAGIEGADKFISLAGLSIEQIKEVANQYNVFGRVSPEQKEALVIAMKENDQTVAMTGDGVNDILALKRADCSIAMASGAEAAKNVSHIVLLDSNFDSLPTVVDEGRRVINNVQRTASLFLVKTIFSVVSTLVFLILLATLGEKYKYPFEPTHFYVWEDASIGLAAFFLSLEKNSERIKGSFLKNIFRKAIPAGIAVLLSVTACFILYIFEECRITYTGIYSFESAVTMSVLCFTVVGVGTLLKICLPLNKYRGFVFAGSTLVSFAALGLAALVTYKWDIKYSILMIDFKSLTPVNYFVCGLVIIITIALFFVGTYIVEVIKGEHQNVKD